MDSISALIFCKDWGAIRITPDYFHDCSTNPEYQVPVNFIGNQNPATGDAYSGFYAYAFTEDREYMSAKLLDTLSVGVKYYMSLKVSLADGTISCACNKMGLKFTTVSYSPCPFCPTHPLMDNSAHLYTNTVITDSVNWTTISGSFVADSAYTYISTGNFFDGNNTDTTVLTGGGTCLLGYYYVDDICVSPDSLTCMGEIGINESNASEKIKVYPNPTTGKFTVAGATGEIQVYDLFGRLVLRSNEPEIDMNSYPAGMYVWRVGEAVRKLILN